MEISELIETLRAEGVLLAEAAACAGTDAEVPTCPGWRVRDLVRHTGMVHRWATTFVAEGLTRPRRAEAEPDLDGPALLDWFRDGHRRLVAALAAAPEGLECWAFLPAPSPLAFWARRQAHETTVHRVDAEAALGERVTRIDAAFALDGIDELLVGFHARERSKVRTDTPRSLRIRATDAADVWTVRLSDAPARTERGATGAADAADCEVVGPAADLYLALWNRLPYGEVDVVGDADVARIWRETSAIEWS
ncbi:maleylpyruvate isomerase family mycothiol-dependent enzyme [Streptomyces sp. KR80]|uniref:maleylpyruvate isomerase family mycothiol-dependent enzyme n=1 Tax=Streptomyces sp. KR80 TaxID=3457426 RepID=UPI003FCF1B24